MATHFSGIEMNSQNVEQAVKQFYSNGATQETHQWLTLAHISPHAWVFSWELMHPEKPPDVQFFGASCLAVKVSRYWNELTPDQYPDLRKRLLDTLLNYNGPKIVLTRICVAVSGLVIHSIAEQWPSPIKDLISLFQPNISPDNQRPLVLLLELLTVIPEEFSTLLLPNQRKTRVRHHLGENVEFVINFLLHVLGQNSNPDVAVQAIKCVQAWVQFGVPLDICGPVVDCLINAVDDEELIDVALDALSNIVSQPDSHNYPNHLMSLLKRLLPLDSLLHRFLAEGSYECCLPVLTLFITFGESHSRLMIDWATSSEEGRDCVLKLICAILAASSCHAQFPVQETISEIPFGFWYILQDDIIACEPEQYQKCVALFGPIYTALVNSMLIKSMYSPRDSEWTADQREAFRCYRTDIADTIMYSFNILRDGLLHSLLQHLDSAISACLADSNAWPSLEACLHAWYAVAESLADSEEEEASPMLSIFLAKIPVLPFQNNPRVISMALDCIGGFSDWLAMHPQLLPHVVPIITSALTNKDLSMSATMSLKDISRDCTESMRPFAGQVIESIHKAIISTGVNRSEAVRLMFPLGKMLSLLPGPQILPTLEPILFPYLRQLEEMAATPSTDQQIRQKIAYILKLISNLFMTLDIKRREDDQPESESIQLRDSLGEPVQQPMFIIIQHCLPLFNKLSENYSSVKEVMDEVCAVLKQAVITLQDEIRPLTQDMVNLTMVCYRTAPYPSALDLLKQFFIMYGREAEMVNPLKGLLSEITNITLNNIQSGPSISDQAEIIDSFFLMLAQILKKQPGLFVNPELNIVLIIQCAIHCLLMPEQHAVKASSSFLNHLITVSREWDALMPIINEHGESIFMQVIKCIGGAANRSYTDSFTDILLAFNKNYFDNLCRYLNTMVVTENFPTGLCSKEAKENFARAILRERSNRRKMLETVREFSLLSRGLLGSEYASQLVLFGL